jgi:UDP-glucose 4-epimerase
MAQYLVTGGAGFIGSNIVRELVARGASVTVLDDFSSGYHRNLAAVREKIRVVEGSICDEAAVREAVQGARYVIHQAAIPSVARSVSDPFPTNQANVEGSLRVLWEAKRAGVERVVMASSSSVYGDTPTLPKHEGMATMPLSPYAVSKLTMEVYGQMFTTTFGLPVVLLRYFNVFGPWQDPSSAYAAVIPKFIDLMLKGERPTIYGDGLQSRDFTFVANVVDANLRACEATEAGGHVMNVACGDRTDLLELVKHLNEILGTDLAPNFEPARAGDVKHSQADSSRARGLLGWAPSVGFAEGLRQTVAWYREFGGKL